MARGSRHRSASPAPDGWTAGWTAGPGGRHFAFRRGGARWLSGPAPRQEARGGETSQKQGREAGCLALV